jgi:hypothetical protein
MAKVGRIFKEEALFYFVSYGILHFKGKLRRILSQLVLVFSVDFDFVRKNASTSPLIIFARDLSPIKA